MAKVIQYRRDIDGLRAVAVLLVVIYHAGYNWVSGGFIGVDVFFVISGFLITGILKREIDAGTFDLKAFYLRRIRRLLPALITVIVISLLVIRTFFLPDDYYFSSKSILYSLVGFSNVLFWKEGKSYFAQDLEEAPFLHTWSLGVEEQFYVFWPFLIIFLTRIPRQYYGKVIGAIFIAFFGLSIWMSHNAPGAAYFLLPARAFELMLGAMLALLPIQRIPLSQVALNGLSFAGLGLILMSGFTLTQEDVFPGINAFWPCLGTALLLLTGSRSQQGLANRLLSLKPFVAVGLISYSLYLWHWPPIAIFHYFDMEITPQWGLIVIAFTIFASWLTWKYVEIPFRSRMVWPFRKTFALLFVTPVLLTIGLKTYLKETDGIGMASRFPENLQGVMEVLRSEPATLFKPCYHGDIENFERGNECLFGEVKENSQPDFILVGDSHANSARGFFEVLAKDAGLTGLEISKGARPFLLDTNATYHNRAGRGITFRKRNDAIKAFLKDFKGAVVIVGNWSLYMNEVDYSFDPPIDKALQDTISTLTNSGNSVYMLEPVPKFEKKSNALCVIKKIHLLVEDDCAISRADLDETNHRLELLFSRLKKEIHEASWIDPKDVMCDEQKCYSYDGETPFYQDESHMTYLGAKKVGAMYLDKHSNPFRKLAEASDSVTLR